ncbi:hypothetical protein BN132_306 [Cronobacter turicensis 564]|nr:hypothetical protein BN132_306 [Cronobacter turicensis 564]
MISIVQDLANGGYQCSNNFLNLSITQGIIEYTLVSQDSF